MKKIKFFKRFFVIAILILCFGFFSPGVLFGAKSFADDKPSDSTKPTYTISFKVKGTLYKVYKLNAGQKITKPTDTAIKDYNWTVEGSNTAFDFNTTTVSNNKITLNLSLATTEMPVIFLQENPNYDANYASSNDYYQKYIGLDIKIVNQGGTVTAPDSYGGTVEEGMEFVGWTDVENGNEYDFSTPTNSLVVLYPIIQKKTYTISFVQKSGAIDTKTATHGSLIDGGTAPAAEDITGSTFLGWYKENDTTQTIVNFATLRFTEDTRFCPLYANNTFGVYIGNSTDVSEMGDVYLIGGSNSSTLYGSFAGETYAVLNKQYTFTIKMASDYDQVTKDQLKNYLKFTYDGTKPYASSMISASATKGEFTCTVYNVSGNLIITLQNVPKNKYNVTFDFTNASGISIVPRADLDYTQNGNKYTVEYGTPFLFTLDLDEKYESAYETLNGNIGISSSDNVGFFGDINGSAVTWNNQKNCYQLVYNSGDSEINLSVSTVECITATLTGVDYLNINQGSVGFDSVALVKWTESNDEDGHPIYIARLKKSQRFTFTATVKDSNGYYLTSFSGTGITQNAAVTNGFIIVASSDTTIYFEVVETIDVHVVASITGATLSFESAISAGSIYNSINNTFKYRVQKYGNFSILFTFNTEYTQAVPVINVSGAMSTTIDNSEFATKQKLTVTNIDEESTITIEPLEKNKYTINYVSNDMASITPYDGYSNIVYYGGELKARVIKTAAYSDATLANENVSFTTQKFDSFTLEEVEEGETTYYLLTIKTIVGDFTVSIDDLIKNSYLITLLGNEYAELSTSNNYAQYNGKYVCTYTLGSAYSKANVSQENISVKNVSDGTTPTLTITVNTSQKTITLDGVMGELIVCIDGLAKNSYTVGASFFKSAIGYSSTKKDNETVAHGSSFVFDISFEDAYSQNLNKFADGDLNIKISTNSGDYVALKPKEKTEYYLRYEISDISGNINFTMDDISINKYTVIFYDTDPVKEIHRYNAVTHGNSITEPTRPVKEGYVFTGWYFSEQGDSQFSSFSSGIGQDLTLYARYNSQTFTVTFVDYDASTGLINRETVKTVNYGKPVQIDTPAAKPGYSKSWWKIEDGVNLNSVKQNYRVIAEYEIDKYTVTFYNDNIIHEKQEVEYGSKASTPATTPVKQGHTFSKWTGYDFVNKVIEGDTDIYAEFTVKEYKVTFKNVTQSNSTIVSFSLNYNTAVVEPVAVTDAEGNEVRGSYKYYCGETIGWRTNTLSDGYVLEGWYADEGLSIRYNFDNPIKGETTIYGNMYVSKVSVMFYVDGVMYMEKQVDYNSQLIGSNVPSVPRKDGYTQKTAIWTLRDLSNEDTTSYNETKIAELTAEFDNAMTVLKNDTKVYALYRINTYRVTFKLPDGTSLVREVYHGGTVTNVPSIDTSFGEVVVMDSNLVRYVTSDTVVYITIIDFLPFLIVAGASCVLVFVVVSLTIAIKNMRRGIRNIKNMENLFKAIKNQDQRLTAMNEEKLKAQIAAQMKEKEKYKRNNFLDN